MKIKIPETLRMEATLDLANLLMKWGFKPSEAIKTAEGFWKKNAKKLEEIY